ncbi:glutamate-5-semialdehyde dehydrogenase [Patescibacteria group bacterium]
MIDQLKKVKQTSNNLVTFSSDEKNQVLKKLADALRKKSEYILEKNLLDLNELDQNDPLYDRLQLTEERIEEIADSLMQISNLEDPIEDVIEERTLENKLLLKKVRVPLGVVAVIYEARPNVTVDVFALTFKTGNACVLKGSSSAQNSNQALVQIIHEVLEEQGLSKDIVCLLDIDRDQTKELLQADDYIDVVIPRGGKQLIDSVRKNSTIPTIETGAGVVHTYFAASGDLEKGKNLIYNAKTRRPSVCNSLDTLLIQKDRLSDLKDLVSNLQEKNVEIFADNQSFDELQDFYPQELLHAAQEEHFGIEFLSLKMSIKTVDGLKQAIEHIQKYSSKHSEAIISEDQKEINDFMKLVDAAAVYSNTSTAFTDGGEFGLGAEIGISTQKLHARGPMSLKELTSYKWEIFGTGQTRN